MSPEQLEEEEQRGIVSASFIMAKSWIPAARVVIQDPIFGSSKRKYCLVPHYSLTSIFPLGTNATDQNSDLIGCEWCYWVLFSSKNKEGINFDDENVIAPLSQVYR